MVKWGDGEETNQVPPAVFYLSNGNQLKGLISHVDYFLYCREDEVIHVVEELETEIHFGNQMNGVFKFCEMQLESKQDGSLGVPLDANNAKQIGNNADDKQRAQQKTAQLGGVMYQGEDRSASAHVGEICFQMSKKSRITNPLQ